MPPPNLTPATAVVIDTLPFAVTVDPESNTELWYRYTPALDQVLSVLCCNAAADANVTIYVGNDPDALVESSFASTAPQLWPVQAAIAVYFAAYMQPYTAATTFLLSVEAGPQAPLQVGDLVIAEDYGHVGQNIYDPSFRGRYPWTWYSPTGTVRHVTATLPATELGAYLPNGICGLIDFDANQIFLYDMVGAITEIGRFVLTDPATTTVTTLGTDLTAFYVAIRPSAGGAPAPSQVYRVTDAGAVTGPIATLAVGDIGEAAGVGGNASSGVSRDGTIFYYAQTTVGGQIHRHNLVTDTALASFAVPAPSLIPADVVVLADGTVAAIFYAGLVQKVAHYAADGTLLQFHEVGTTGNWQIHHIAIDGTDNPDRLWVWTQDEITVYPTGVGLSTFQLLQLSTGDVLQTFTKDSWFTGRGPLDTTGGCVPPARFGAPDSCPLLVVLQAATVPPAYTLDERHIRRLRRAPHVNHEHKRVFFRSFELDLERGQGLATGQGDDPIITLRLSRDGGQTWGEPMPLRAGRLGAYTQRVIARRLGVARDTVFEVTVSDPVAWSLVGAWLDLEPGTH